MTREEAISTLRNVAWLGTDKKVGQVEEALHMAVTALQTNGDTISRRGAIETVNSHRYVYENKHLNDYEQGWNDACDYCADEWLDDLPSVQPEIIRCKDCKYYDTNDHCFLQGAEPDDYCSYAERKSGD